jgi:rsbT co-antagonist protein RsbR
MSRSFLSSDDPTIAVQVAKRYAGVLQHAPFAVIEHGDDLRITGWNRGAERIFGYTSEEAVGQDLIHLILQDEDGAAWRQRAREGSDAPSILAGVRKDGRAVTCEWVHQLERDEQGAPAGAVCFGRDVTTQLEQAALYRRKEQLLRALLDNLPLNLWAIDPLGIFTVHEGKDPAVMGFAPGKALGRSIFELYPETAPQIHQALAGDQAHWLEQVHGAHGENWAVPVLGEQGDVTAVLGFTLDVSKSKHMEQYLRAQLDLVRQQKQVIRALSIPIIEVWDHVLMLPMVEAFDDAHTAEVMSSLLDAVVCTRARFAILDLTGVEAVAPKTAAYLIDLVGAVRLLGAEGVVTGIQPNVAQAIVALGLDLRRITTLSNLRAGLRHCIVQMNRERGVR